jgi:hypothetical protein
VLEDRAVDADPRIAIVRDVRLQEGQDRGVRARQVGVVHHLVGVAVIEAVGGLESVGEVEIHGKPGARGIARIELLDRTAREGLGGAVALFGAGSERDARNTHAWQIERSLGAAQIVVAELHARMAAEFA